MKLLVQKFLETHTFAELSEQHAVGISFSKCGTKFSLNYDMINAKDTNVLANQCRGLILSNADGDSLASQAEVGERGKLCFDKVCPGETVVQCYGFDRFFNYGQGAAAEIDWTDPRLKVLSKLDGTLTMLYFDLFKEEWFVATRSVPEADILLDGTQYTFSSLFMEGLKNVVSDPESWLNDLDTNIIYCFELTSYYNRIVCLYPRTSITLLGARNRQLLTELHLDEVDVGSVPKVAEFDLKSIQDVLNWVSDQKPTEHEGVVILDSKFNRIKVKNAAYVVFNKARDSLIKSDRNCLEAVLLGQDDDLAPMMPQEIADKMAMYKAKLPLFQKFYDDNYDLLMSQLGDNPTKRDFAISLQQTKLWQTPFFLRFDGKIKNAREFLDLNRKDGTWSASFLDKLLSVM